MCKAVEKGIGQPCGLKFLIEEGYAPSCGEYIPASSPVKSGAGIFCKKGQKIFRSRAKRRVLTGSGRSDLLHVQGRDEERAFSGPNKELGFRAERKKEAQQEEQRAAAQPVFQRYGQCRFTKSEEVNPFPSGSGPALLHELD